MQSHVQFRVVTKRIQGQVDLFTPAYAAVGTAIQGWCPDAVVPPNPTTCEVSQSGGEQDGEITTISESKAPFSASNATSEIDNV
jgi:hypothetical protein